MKYHCSDCNYTTSSNYNYKRHEASITHKRRAKEYVSDDSLDEKGNFKCEYCYKKFNQQSHLTRHLKNCLVMRDKIDKLKSKELEILKKELSEAKNEIKYYQKDIKAWEDKFKMIDGFHKEKLELVDRHKERELALVDEHKKTLSKENEYHKTLVNNAGNLAQSTVSAMKYITNNFKNTEPITAFDNFKLLQHKSYGIAENMVSYYRQHRLHEYIGNIIIEQYKKNNPQKQQIWNTDTSRLAYVIRETINNKAEWFIDKKGYKMKTYTIKPILNYIKKEIEEYIAELYNWSPDDDILKEMEIGNKALADIRSDVLGKAIINYISPSFYLDRNMEAFKYKDLDEKEDNKKKVPYRVSPKEYEPKIEYEDSDSQIKL